MPFSSTLGSEIRKAAYSTHNLFSQPLHYVRDKAIPLRLLATAKGLAFITVMKGGFIFAPRFGKFFSCFLYLHTTGSIHLTENLYTVSSNRNRPSGSSPA